MLKVINDGVEVVINEPETAANGLFLPFWKILG
jgi:hypothetical protein